MSRIPWSVAYILPILSTVVSVALNVPQAVALLKPHLPATLRARLALFCASQLLPTLALSFSDWTTIGRKGHGKHVAALIASSVVAYLALFRILADSSLEAYVPDGNVTFFYYVLAMVVFASTTHPILIVVGELYSVDQKAANAAAKAMAAKGNKDPWYAR